MCANVLFVPSVGQSDMNVSVLPQALKQLYQPQIPRTSKPIYITNITSQKSELISWIAGSWLNSESLPLPLLMESQAFALQREAASNYVQKHVSTVRALGKKKSLRLYMAKSMT